eukprot:TRINITY_DN15073_c0_g1_i1.p1 TRINITY_DN15073_c0_g1~~TRINITY_DN15073_c0_g1_i1.p1  ORF type:complete len:278 (+),score=85.59 TRINITY_DN15073_c0_g1_i1:110-835(+)
MLRSLVGSEMCIRDRVSTQSTGESAESMSLQWQFVFLVLMIELLAAFVLCVPWPQSIQRAIVKGVGLSSKLSAIITILRWTFAIVLVLFLDAARQVYFKMNAQNLTADESKHDHRSFDSRLFEQSGLFRAERNMYLAGMVLVLGLVLNRLYTFMHEVANTRLHLEVMKSQSANNNAAMQNPEILKMMAEAAAAEKQDEKQPAASKEPSDEKSPSLEDLPSVPTKTAEEPGLRRRGVAKKDD